ncbi:MAG: heme o synthase [Rhodobacteraceae bacterium]|nr:heme o synthase [Paracoccaceae bacterium]MYG10511.1 protoheme IX farnesyltransferase [Paracoccaceae bacterium]
MVDSTVISKPQEVRISEVIELLKPRVMSLVIFTAFIGMIIAPTSINPILALASLIFIAIGAGGSGALNMWWDEDIDRLMKRTRNRPVPTGTVSGDDARLLGLWCSGFAIFMLALTANFLAAGILAFTIFFYVVVYTMYLKRRTAQNIVIGGAAGAFPPLIGWAVVTNGIALEPILLVLLIFLWTPPHFWALALVTKEEYSLAKVPMLTVTRGERVTRRYIFWYSLSLIPIGFMIAFSSIGGPLTLGLVIVLNIMLTLGSYQVMTRDAENSASDGYNREKALFKLSIWYLFVMFAGLGVESMLHAFYEPYLVWPEVF